MVSVEVGLALGGRDHPERFEQRAVVELVVDAIRVGQRV
jgi:hypothetical protein